MFSIWIIIIDYLLPQSVIAAWMDDNWAYRKAIPIATHTASETNVFETFQLDTATVITNNKLQSSCQDIRITDISGNLLKYHVGRTNACNTSNTTIDFLIPTMPAGAQTYYVYYGNPNAPSADAGAFSQSQCAQSCTTNPALNSEENTPGPSAYFKFNEGYGTTTTDSSSNKAAGTLSGATVPAWKTEDMCVSGKCLFFDGSSSYVTAGNGSAVQITGNLTLSAWIRLTTTNSVHDVIAKKGASGQFGYRLFTDSNGKLNMEVSSDGTATTTVTGSTTLAASRWYFVEGVYSTSTSLTIYVNGIQDGQNTTSIPASIKNSSANLEIGSETGSSRTNYLAGFIDEVKIYSYVRSATQVTTDYNSKGAGTGASENTNNSTNNPSALSDGLVGYWKEDETTNGANATDSSGNGISLTDSGTVNRVAGKFGNAGSFVSASSKYQSTSSSAGSALDLTGNVTVAAWINPTTVTGAQDITGKWDGSNDSYLLQQNGSDIRFYIGSTSNYGTTSSLGLSTSTWYHIVANYNASAATVSIYINGAPKTVTVTGTIPSSITSNAGKFHIGADSSTTSATNFYNGTLDEVRVYNRALSSTDVANLYNFAPGPVGEWDFEEGSGTTANDSSTNANTGTLQSGTTWVTGKFGQAMNISSTSTGLTQAPNSTSLTISQTLTASAWINMTSTATNQTVLGKWGGSTNEWYMTNGSSDGTLLSVFITSSINGYTATGALSPNTWTFVEFVYDGTQTGNANRLKIYINGTQQSLSFNGTIPASITTGNSPVMMGALNGTGNRLQGSIDDVRIYNYARTPNQVVEDMNASHPAPGSPVGTPVGWWKFNEGYGTTANNSGNCLSTCNGTMNNFSSPATSTSGWTQSGKFGQALIFNGTNNYIAMASDVTQFKITSDLTLSAWVNLTTNNAVHDIVAKDGTSGSFSYRLFTDANGKLNMEISGDGTTVTGGTNGQTVTGATTLSSSTWYHVAGVYSAGNSIKIYVNGIQDGSSTSVPSSIFNSTAILDIGSQNVGGSNFMSGTIDELKVYAQTITAAQVSVDMNGGQSIQYGNLGSNSSYQKQAANQEYCVPGDSTSCAAPVGRWDFEEGSGSSVNDSSDNGYTGTWGGSSTTRYVSGKFGQSGVFNLNNTDRVNFGQPGKINNISAMTLSAWIYARSWGLNNFGRIFDKAASNAANNGWAFRLKNDSAPFQALRFSVNYTSVDLLVNTNANALSLNTWNYVVLTWDGSTVAANVHIYINGVEDGYNTQTDAHGARVDDSASSLRIGNDASPFDRTFDGYIDDARIYNYVRTPAQVAWEYNRGGPVAYYKFDDCQGTTVRDSSVNGYNGTQSGTTAGTCTTASSFWGGASGNSTTNSGKINYAGTFNGSSDKVQTSAITPINAAGNTYTGVSWGGWFYPTSSAASKTIIEKATNSTTNGEFHLTTNASSQPVCGIFYSSAFNDASAGSTALTLNAWNHIICTYDGANIKTYLNGILIGTTANTNAITAASSILYLGQSSGGSQFYSGRMDEVRVYNYALTTTQVQLTYNNGATTFAPATGAP